jgi:hypothetical protein
MENCHVTLIFNNNLNHLEFENLFLNPDTFKILKKETESYMGYELLPYDIFWNLDESLLTEKGNLLYNFEENKSYELDRPYSYMYITKRIIQMDFYCPWEIFLNGMNVRKEFEELGMEIALKINSKQFIFLPSEQTEDYVFGSLIASKIVWSLSRFDSIEQIIEQLNTQNIADFDLIKKNYDSYVLIKV